MGYSWNDFNATCGVGACTGLLGGTGPNLTGWTWASIYEVGDLFAATSPHPGGISTYFSPSIVPFTDFVQGLGFLITTDALIGINFGLSAVVGYSSTLAAGGSLAHAGLVQISLGFPAAPPAGSSFNTATTFSSTENNPNIGGWLYRPAPVPATI